MMGTEKPVEDMTEALTEAMAKFVNEDDVDEMHIVKEEGGLRVELHDNDHWQEQVNGIQGVVHAILMLPGVKVYDFYRVLLVEVGALIAHGVVPEEEAVKDLVEAINDFKEAIEDEDSSETN